MAGKRECKYPVRLTLFVTAEMDDFLDDICEIMQISKSEYIRYCLGSARKGMEGAIGVMKEQMQDKALDFSSEYND